MSGVRLALPAQATVKGGVASLSFGPVPLGRIWTAVASSWDAPGSSTWIAYLSTAGISPGQAIGAWSGPGSGGPFQLVGGESLVITGTGLTAAIANGVLVGYDAPADETDLLPPVPLANASPPQQFYRLRDEFYWPAIVGETLAPTLTGGAVYGSISDLPMYRPSNAAGGGTAAVTFPNVPRVNKILGLNSLRIDFAAAWFGAPDGGHPDPMFRFIFGGNPWVGFRVPKATVRWNADYNPDGGAPHVVDLGVSLSTFAPDLLSIVLDAAGTATFLVNGAAKLTVPNVWKPGATTNGLLPIFSLTLGSINFAETVAGQLRFAYS